MTVDSGPFGVAVHGATKIVYAPNTREGTVLVIAPAASTPGALPGLSVTSGNGLAILAFTRPTSDGGSTITGYTVTVTTTSTCPPASQMRNPERDASRCLDSSGRLGFARVNR